MTPHDVRDYDFQLPPVIGSVDGRPVVFGAGKAGLVIAWNRSTHTRLWQTAVGIHRNDRGRLPRHPVSVCPGLLGGVETPMASAGGYLYVPVVDLCMRGSATGYERLDHVNVSAAGKARSSPSMQRRERRSGRCICRNRTSVARPSPTASSSLRHSTARSTASTPVTVVFSGRASVRAGINACPALASKTLLVGAGVPTGRHAQLELTAFSVG